MGALAVEDPGEVREQLTHRGTLAGQTDEVDYDPTQFSGTAPYYLRGRPPYSAALAEVLAVELGLDGTGRLLDVGSGPGTVAVQLATLFDHITVLEPDGAMLDEARRHATAEGLSAIDFVQATAEELPELQLAPMRVVTFAQSLHRMDRARVLAAVHDILAPGGALVILTHDPARPAPRRPDGIPAVPHAAIRTLVGRHLGGELRSGARPASSYADERFEESLARTPFGRPRVRHAPGRADLVRDVDEVVAGCLSMSFAAPALFGPGLGDFVADLRAVLDAGSPSGRYWEWPGDTEILIATKDLP